MGVFLIPGLHENVSTRDKVNKNLSRFARTGRKTPGKHSFHINGT